MKRTKFKLIFLCLMLGSGSRIFSQGLGDGFLALNVAFEWERSQQKNESQFFDYFNLPISFSGASTGYEIVTNLFITTELLHLGKYYTGDAAFLEPGEVHPFSFASFEIQYQIAKWKIFYFNAGIKLGHYGYLSNDWIDPAYILFIAPKASIYIFLGEHFMFLIPPEIPIAIYANSMSKFFTVKTGIELTFDPVGPIVNPISNSALFTLGMEYSWLDLETSSGVSRQIDYLKPYFRFSLLY